MVEAPLLLIMTFQIKSIITVHARLMQSMYKEAPPSHYVIYILYL